MGEPFAYKGTEVALRAGNFGPSNVFQAKKSAYWFFFSGIQQYLTGKGGFSCLYLFSLNTAG